MDGVGGPNWIFSKQSGLWLTVHYSGYKYLIWRRYSWFWKFAFETSF